jgi:hypothetical protein
MDIDHDSDTDDYDSDALSTSSSEFDEMMARSRRRRIIMTMVATILAAAMEIISGLFDKQEYHTSALSGHGWVMELLNGHPDRIRCELGVSHHVFDLLLQSSSHGLQRLTPCHTRGAARNFFVYLCYRPFNPACRREISTSK